MDDFALQAKGRRCRSSTPSSCRWSSTRLATWPAWIRPIEVKVFGPEPAILREEAEKGWQDPRARVEGIVDVNRDVLLGNPDIVVRPDSVQTARMGLTEMDVEGQLNAALYGQVASTVPEQDRMTKIRVRYPDSGPVPTARAWAASGRVAMAAAPSPSLASSGPSSRLMSPGIGFVPLEPARLDPSSPHGQRALARVPPARHHGDRLLSTSGDIGSVNKEPILKALGTQGSLPVTDGSLPAIIECSRRRSPAS